MGTHLWCSFKCQPLYVLINGYFEIIEFKCFQNCLVFVIKTQSLMPTNDFTETIFKKLSFYFAFYEL